MISLDKSMLYMKQTAGVQENNEGIRAVGEWTGARKRISSDTKGLRGDGGTCADNGYV